METKQLLSRDEYKELIDRYHEICDNGFRRAQSLQHSRVLGVNSDSMAHSTMTPMKRETKKMKNSKLYTATSAKWQNVQSECFEMDEYDDGDAFRAIVQSESEESKSNGTGKSAEFLRLKFVLNLFKNHFLEQMVYRNDDDDGPSSSEKAIYVDLFAECLSEYDAVALFNDFALIKRHRVGAEELRDCKVSGPLSVCCGGLVRECRESEDENVRKITMNDDRLEFLKEYLNSLDDKQCSLIEWTSKIHMFINHQIDGDDETLRHDASSGKVISKFVNEMPSDLISMRGDTKMDHLVPILEKCDLSSPECMALHLLLNNEYFDTDAMEEDLQTPADSNLFPMLTGNEITAKKVLYHLQRLSVFRFGFCRFTHWKHFDGNHEYIASPKYANLKQECIQNQLHPISLGTFNRIASKARTLRQTKKALSLKARHGGLDNDKYEVAPDSLLSVSHIVVLLMYCNHTDLQNDYKKKGCREMVDIQSFEDTEFTALKSRNTEIAWWYRLITESVLFWGNRARPHHTFYTGLNIPLLFDTFSPNFFSIFSTTVSRGVAYRFADAKGVILQMVPSVGSWDQFLNVEWLSDFDYEEERLFVFANELALLTSSPSPKMELCFETANIFVHSPYFPVFFAVTLSLRLCMIRT